MKNSFVIAGLYSLSLSALNALEVVNTTPANNQAGLSVEAGQTFTTPVLGSDNRLVSITIRGPQTGANATVYTLKVWQDTDGDFETWDPGALVATSTNSLAIDANNGDFTYLFSEQVLSENSVYAFSFNDGVEDHAVFRAGLTNAEGVALADGALFSSGVQPFGGAFDISCVITTTDGVAALDLVWTGAIDGNWDTATTNWMRPDTTATAFSNGDRVTFNDTASTGAVTLVGTIEAASIAITNDTLAYSFGGTSLAGPGALVKDGPGSLTFNGNSGYKGGTTLTAGTITAGDGATSGEIGQGPVSLAAGTTLTIARSDLLDYKATPKMREVSGEGDIILDGGGTLFNYTGGGVDFSTPGTWSGFSGNLTIINSSEFQTIRNGANAMGTGTIVLGDATSSGALSQIEGNWTWTNAISIVGPENKIINRSTNAPRTLKLQGPISGGGGLTFEDATAAMTDPNLGFIITNDLSLTTPLSIPFGVPVRVGGVPGDVSVFAPGLNADSFGSLGSTGIANEGFLTFARTDSHTVSSAITGAGEVRIGIPSDAALGDTSTQVVTFETSQAYEGITTINNSTLVVPMGVTLDSAFINVSLEGVLAGNGTLAGDIDLSGTVSPGAGVGTLTSEGFVTFLDESNYACEISEWVANTSDVFAVDELDFFTAPGGIAITISANSLDDFSETNQTFTIITAANGINGFDPNNFTVDDSAFYASTGRAGTWALQQNVNTIELVYTLGVPNDFDSWAVGFLPEDVTDPAGDNDNDGLNNEAEYQFGLDPTDGSSANPITGQLDPSTGTFSYTRRNPALASGLVYTYESSTTLDSWDPMTPVLLTSDSGSPVETITITVPAALIDNPTLFIRVSAN